MTDKGNDFERQLAARLRAHENRVPAELAPAIEHAGRRHWTALGLVVGAGLVAGAMLGVALLNRGLPNVATTSSSPVATQPPSSHMQPTPSQASRLPLTNFEVSDSAGVGLGQVNGLFESDGLFYAYGSYPRDAEKGPQAAVWTSTDHVGWTRVSDFPGIEGQEPSVAEAVTDMTRGPDGFVAVGLVSGIDVVVPRVWFSPDGRTWSLVMPNAQGGCGRILGVSAGGSGYVAVGYSCPDFATANTAVWTSSDGQKWEQVQIPELQNASLTDVVQRGEQLIIVGQRADRAVSFVSTNGEDWTESNAQADLRDAEMGSVIANGGSLLAIGRRGTSTDAPSAAVWTSDDGLTWTIAIGASTGEIIDAAAPSGPAGFVVIGGHFPSRSWQYDPSTEPPADTVEMWSSADGETFESASVLTGESLDWIGQPLVVGNEILVPARRWSSDSGAFVPVILRRAG